MKRAFFAAFGDKDERKPALFSQALRYGAVVGLVFLALWVRWVMDPWLGHIQPFATFYFVVTLVAWWGGWRLATFAAVLGLVAGCWLFLPLKESTLVQEAPHLIQAFVYCFLAVAIIYLVHFARMMQSLAQARAEALREQVDDYRVTFEKAMLGHAIIDPATQRITRVNSAFCRLTGYPAEELLHLSLGDLLPSENGNHMLDGLKAALAGEADEYQGEQHFRCKSGQLIWGRLSVASVRDAQGKPLRAIAQFEDITESKHAETALRWAEQKLRYHVENSPLAIIEWDEQFRVTRWTGEAERVFGWKAEEALGKHANELGMVYAEDRPAVDRVISQLLQGEARQVFNSNRNYRKDGSVVHCDWYNSVLLDEQGKTVSVLSLALDVTARKTAVAALLRSKQEWERTFDSVPDLIAILDKENRIMQVNQPLARRLGLRREQCIGQICYQCIHGLDHPPEACPHAMTNLDQQHHTGELHETRLGGEFLVSTTPLLDERGEMVGTVHLSHDITNRKRAEEALLRQNQRLQLLQQTAGHLLSTKEPENIVRNLHQQIATYFQIDVFLEHLVDPAGQALVLKSCAGLNAELKQQMSRLEIGEGVCGVVARQRQPQLVSHVQSSHHPREQLIKQMGVRSYCCVPLLMADRLLGTLFLGSRLRSTFEEPDRDFFQTLAHYAAIALERTRLEQELRHHATHLEQVIADRTAKLREMIAELEHFSYAITHDMRAPLRAMRMFGEFLLEHSAHNLNPVGKDYLQRIIASAKRMDALVTDSLQYSQAVQQEPALTAIDPARLLHGMVQSYPAFQAPHADIRIEGDLPLVLGAEAGLTQCFSNLLNNAVKFVAPGTLPQVRIWADRREGHVRVWFADNGIGIPREYQSRIFDMFQRLSTEYEGTGIGLALVRKLTERMGGKVGVESEPGQGSRFWLDLQAAASAV